MSKEQPQWPNPEPSAKKLKKKSNLLLGGGMLLAAAGISTFFAGDFQKATQVQLPLAASGIGLTLAGVIIVGKSTETYETALTKEAIEKHLAKNSKPL